MLSLPILDLLQECDDPPLTPEALEELQRTLGLRFPEDYADFLLRFNGGHFRGNVKFSMPNPTEFNSAALVNSFIGEPNDGIEHHGLVWWAELVGDPLPEGFLPIAHCNGQDYVMLKIVGPDSEFGNVWFWNSCAVFDAEPRVVWLADSFNEFLSMLVFDVFGEREECETLPLFQYVERGGVTRVEEYLKQGGDVEARNEQGYTLLMAAVIHQWPKIVGLLLDHSADPNARDQQGRTPLHHAATHSIDSVKLLLAAGADAKARDHEGKSVLGEWSYRADQILRAHGAEE